MWRFLTFFLFIPVLVWAAPIEVAQLLLPDQPATQVTTDLMRYQFTELGGTMRSAYIHFATYNMPSFETVPGWTGTELGPGVSLPFEVWLGNEAVLDPHSIEISTPRPEETQVLLSYQGKGLRVKKEFLLQSDALYTMGVGVQVDGEGDSVIRLILGHLPTGQKVPELLYLYDGKVQRAPLAPGAYAHFQGLGLVSNTSIFFLRLDDTNALPFLGRNAAGQPVFGLEARGSLVARGTMYTGRNRYLLLREAGLTPLSQSGAWTMILVGVIQFFDLLYQFTGNYGWAIILFTLVTRIILYPLMRNQYRSMAKMQRLAPKIKKLQERFKDDRATLQQQMMELYRQEKVNPLGGCLPLLIQMPILIILWQAIMYSAEQIHLSPGFLWMRDLSQPDPYYILVTLATGVQLLFQWWTQRRMPEQPAGGTQALGYIFPIIMAVFLLNFPAGLWLYWMFTTIFQLGQQMFFDWEMAKEARARPSDGSEGA